jgi:VanZ family protein
MRSHLWIAKFAAFALVAAGLIYGSLYPWVFIAPQNGIGPVKTLLATTAVTPDRGDFLVNIILYLPLGYFCVAILPSRWPALLRFVLAAITGTMLSTGIEILQYYDPGRVPSAGDVYANAFGTALGAAYGIVSRHGFRAAPMHDIQWQPFPALLLISWLGSRLYPYVPTTSVHKYLNALKPLVVHPHLTLYDSFRYTVMWLTVAALLEAIWGQRRSLTVFPALAAAIIVAKIVIVTHVVEPDEIAGMGFGFVIWFVLLRQPFHRRMVFVALPLFAFILVWRLQPFHFDAATHPFGWIPFYSLIHGSVGVDTQTYFVKVFFYGSLVWFAAEAGLPTWMAGSGVALFLLGLSAGEMYLPGRSAEVTDAVMALIIAFLASAAAPPRGDLIVEGRARRVS